MAGDHRHAQGGESGRAMTALDVPTLRKRCCLASARGYLAGAWSAQSNWARSSSQGTLAQRADPGRFRRWLRESFVDAIDDVRPAILGEGLQRTDPGERAAIAQAEPPGYARHVGVEGADEGRELVHELWVLRG